MQRHKITDKQKSEMIMRVYFPELYPKGTSIPFPVGMPKFPKEIEDRWTKSAIAFIQLN